MDTLKNALLCTAALSLGVAASVTNAAPTPGFARMAAADTDAALRAAPLKFEVFLPLRDEAGLDKLLLDQQDKASPLFHKWLTPASFAQRFGPSTQSLARVQSELAAHGLKVVATHTRSFEVVSDTATAEQAFKTSLHAMVQPGGVAALVAMKPLTLPDAMQQEGAVVAAFASHPNARVHSHNTGPFKADSRISTSGPYFYNDLKQAYDYPAYNTGITGVGSSVAILISNDVRDDDIKLAFNHEHFKTTTGKPLPKLAGRVLINGGAPFNANASFESSLDVQQSLGSAPDAAVTLVNIPDLSDANILAGYRAIVDANIYDIASASFGGCELFYTAAYNNGVSAVGTVKTLDSVLKQGNAQGITFVASSGDSGALGCPDAGINTGNPVQYFSKGVEFPASSPNITAVGGGNLVTTPPTKSLASNYVRENGEGDPEVPYDPYGTGIPVRGGYWGAGGGLSVIFGTPSYQSALPAGLALRRAVPDVGFQVGGCPGIAVQPCGPDRSAAVVFVGGHAYGVIGTSVAAPEFAGALALLRQVQGGRLGNVNTYLYRLGAQQTASTSAQGTNEFYHRGQPAFDGLYSGGGGYNFIYGNGTADIRALFGLKAFPPAGKPQTITNP